MNAEIVRQVEKRNGQLGWYGVNTGAAQMMAKSAQMFTKVVRDQGSMMTKEQIALSQEIILQYFSEEDLANLMFQQDLNNNLA